MKYNKDKLYEQAIEVAEKKKCFFIEQVVSFMPCAKQTFYDYFPIDSDEMDAIKAILDKNKIEIKSAMYKKWFDSDNATLQVALMKLIATENEAHRLNGSSQKIEHAGKIQTTPIIVATPELKENIENELDRLNDSRD